MSTLAILTETSRPKLLDRLLILVSFSSQELLGFRIEFRKFLNFRKFMHIFMGCNPMCLLTILATIHDFRITTWTELACILFSTLNTAPIDQLCNLVEFLVCQCRRS